MRFLYRDCNLYTGIIQAKEIHGDSCGRKGLGETTKCAAQGGSPAARGKRSVFPQRWADERI
ncbi:hypothetical protein CWR45_02765 [Oceanobacillus chungangensis]|uniref:Uncharacterized protein n=1 Tax=Oceanobacillus chungangensis TaxID=1229152 RepID=A0A3D8PYE9_9BACI|nr:hypothetical protein CWR45_02765 [Oceanobacillus chungangensis]